LALADDETITNSHVNAILVAINFKSIACLKFLIERFELRQSIIERQTDVVYPNGSRFSFTNLLIPLVLKIKDDTIL